MGVCGVFFGCRGVVGFNGRCLGASSGDGGFILACNSGRSGGGGYIVATLLRPVREFVRPARSQLPKIGLFSLTGRILSRSHPESTPAGRTLSRRCGPQPGRHASTCAKVLVVARRAPDREDSTPSDRVDSSRSGGIRRSGGTLWSLRRPPHQWRWGFCYMRGWLTACRRRVGSLMSQFPPFGGAKAVT